MSKRAKPDRATEAGAPKRSRARARVAASLPNERKTSRTRADKESARKTPEPQLQLMNEEQPRRNPRKAAEPIIEKPPGFNVDDGMHLAKTGKRRHLGRVARDQDGKYTAFVAVAGGYRFAGTHDDFMKAMAALSR